MDWKLWQRGATGPLPVSQELIDVVRSRMRVPDSELASLMMVEQRGIFANRPVRFFRVYDPAKLGNVTAPVKYRLLDNHPSAIVFDGHSESNHGIIVYDRRPGAKPAPAP